MRRASTASPNRGLAAGNASPQQQPGSTSVATAEPTTPAMVVEEVDTSMQVGVLIAMPSQYRPRAEQLRILEESESDVKGKARSAHSSESDLEAHVHGEEEDVPEVVVGVAEMPWRVRVERPASMPQEPQTQPQAPPGTRRS